MNINTALAAGLLALAICAPVEAQQAPTLYKRLGGYDALAAVTDDFLGRLAADQQFGRFFVGHSADSIKRIRQLIVDQLCAATGGPCVYTGRDMKTAHAGLDRKGDALLDFEVRVTLDGEELSSCWSRRSTSSTFRPGKKTKSWGRSAA